MSLGRYEGSKLFYVYNLRDWPLLWKLWYLDLWFKARAILIDAELIIVVILKPAMKERAFPSYLVKSEGILMPLWLMTSAIPLSNDT